MHPRIAKPLINTLGSSAAIPLRLRIAVWRLAGVKVGRVVDIGPRSWMNTTRLELGDLVFLNAGLTIDGFERVQIGAGTWLAVNVTLLTSTHEIGAAERRADAISSAPIVIGAGCWIGANVTVLPGVTIGDGCVVGAGAVVRDDLEPHAVYVGAPARLVRRLDSSGGPVPE